MAKITITSGSGVTFVRNVDVAATPDGGFIVTWDAYFRDSSSSRVSKALLQRFDADGQALGGRITLVETEADFIGGEGPTPSVASRADGSFVAAWAPDESVMSDDTTIVVQSFSANGTAGNKFTITSGSGVTFVRNVDVAATPDGGFIVTWDAYFRDSSSSRVSKALLQRFDADGQALGGRITLVETEADFVGAAGPTPSVASRADGSFVAAWAPDDSVMSDDATIVVQSFSANGTAGNKFTITSGSGVTFVRNVDVAATPDGGFIVTWDAYFRDSSSSRVSKALLQRFDADGQALGGRITLVETEADFIGGEGPTPSVASRADGSFVAAWAPDESVMSDDTTIVVELSRLFTESADTINFNALNRTQKSEVEKGASLYNALDGEDRILLPNLAKYQLTTSTVWNPEQLFDGGSGNDTISSGDGNDNISGGDDKISLERDELILLGRPSDYSFVDAERSDGTIVTTLTRTATGEVDTIEHFEYMDFSKSQLGINVVSGGLNAVQEMALMSTWAYGTIAVPERGWRPVHANELGLAAQADDGKWTMSNGVFRAELSVGDAKAHVYSGVFQGVTTLAVAFAGTDDLSDVGNWPRIGTYYKNYAPLVKVLRSYIDETDVGRVLVTGHSLGGAIAQLFMQDVAISHPDRYYGATFASPGAKLSVPDIKMVHFERTGDPVPPAGGIVGYHTSGETVLIPTHTVGINPLEHLMARYLTAIQNLSALDETDRPDFLNLVDHDPKVTSRWLAGDNKANELEGDSGIYNESIFGQGGADTIWGYGGNDLIKGGKERDSLIGGAGEDELYGGAGADFFIYEKASDTRRTAPDTIFKFQRALDKIDLSDIDAKTVIPFNQAFDFIGRRAFSGSRGELRYDFDGEDTMILGDVNGDRQADFKLYLEGTFTLTGGQFIL